MRLFIAVAATAIACCAFDGASNSAKADPYRWCAQYGARPLGSAPPACPDRPAPKNLP
jgi:hypothetical protein